MPLPTQSWTSSQVIKSPSAAQSIRLSGSSEILIVDLTLNGSDSKPVPETSVTIQLVSSDVMNDGLTKSPSGVHETRFVGSGSTSKSPKMVTGSDSVPVPETVSSKQFAPRTSILVGFE